MKIDPHISIIIVGPMDYNKFFIKCIKSYLNQSFKNFEIVLIIWGHKKIKEIKELMKRTKINTKQIKFIKYFGNPGYARGNNLGVVRSEYNYILISNPDVVVPRDFLKKLVESYFWLKELKNERIILGPRICNIDSEYQHSRRNINFLGFSNIDTSKTNKILRTEVTSGCAFLLEKELFKNLGGFDESYFMYHEDIDFSVRALKNSIKQYVNNSIRILHLRDSKKIKLNKFKYYYHERNRIKFTLEHSTKKKKMIISHILFEPIHFAYALFRGFILIRFKIYRDLFQNFTKLIKKSGKENNIFDSRYNMSGVFYEINSKSFILDILNLYSKMIFYLYHH